MRGMKYMFLLPLLFSVVSPAKILVAAPFPGSHYFSVAHLGQLLADQGHSVYFTSTIHDGRLEITSPNFHVIPPLIEVWTTADFAVKVKDCLFPQVDHGREGTMYADTMEATDACRSTWTYFHSKIIAFYGSPEFEEFVESSGFDLVVAEHYTNLPLLAATHPSRIPLITYIPYATYREPREAQNLPMFLASEPGKVNSVFRNGLPPGLFERLFNLANFLQGSYRLHWGVEKLMKPMYEKYGVTGEELMERVELYVVNDHLAFSFPFQIPNNVLLMGGAALKPAKPLTGPLLQFLDNNQGKSVLYLSTGSYVNLAWVRKHRIILEGLLSLDNVAVVLKVNSPDQFDYLPSDRFYRTTWAPQQDLLASGRVNLFLSHCGNNGRMETIYNAVPILCLPMFADQSMNGNIVEFRGFGEMLLPSEIDADTFSETVIKMLKNEEIYKSKMLEARYIFDTEPANGTAKLLYFTDLLLKYGNLKFLRNDLMKEQSFVEIHSLDVLAVLILAAILVIGMSVKCVIVFIKGKKRVSDEKKDC